MKVKAYIIDCYVPDDGDGDTRVAEMRIEPDNGLHTTTIYMPDVVCCFDAEDLGTLIEVLEEVLERMKNNA